MRTGFSGRSTEQCWSENPFSDLLARESLPAWAPGQEGIPAGGGCKTLDIALPRKGRVGISHQRSGRRDEGVSYPQQPAELTAPDVGRHVDRRAAARESDSTVGGVEGVGHWFQHQY